MHWHEPIYRDVPGSRGDAEIVTKWTPGDALDHCPVIPYRGHVWRIHAVCYAATDAGGSLRQSGRYHHGMDRYSESETWPALYTALTPDACVLEALGENVKEFSPEALEHLNDCWLTELDVDIGAVLNCTEPGLLGLTREDIVNDSEYRYTQAIGAAANSAGHEGLLVPSATEASNNLVIFPRNLRPGSTITVVHSHDPRRLLGY